MSSELFSKEEILETRTKPGFLTSLFGRGFIFVQYSQKSKPASSRRACFSFFEKRPEKGLNKDAGSSNWEESVHHASNQRYDKACQLRV